MATFGGAFLSLIVAALALTSICRAEENTGAALDRKCDTYLDGVYGKPLSAAEAEDAGYCSGFIDTAVAAARLAHARRGLPLRDGEASGNVDKTAYQVFAVAIQLGVDVCLPDNIGPQEVAMRLHRWARLNPELLRAGEVPFLDFMLFLSYPCQ